MPGFQHVLTAGPGVLRVVLVVAVHGDDAHALRAVLEKKAERVFQRGTLAFVDFVGQQGDFRVLGGKVGEIVEILRLAAVIDQNDIGKTVLQKSVHHSDELVIRVEGRQDHGYPGQFLHT